LRALGANHVHQCFRARDNPPIREQEGRAYGDKQQLLTLAAELDNLTS